MVLGVILLQVGWSDLKRRSVSNRWLVAGAVVGIWLRGADFLIPAMMVLAAAFWGFCFRLMGAGDGKLMALIAGYLGLYDGIGAICAGIIIGGIWSICYLWHTRDIRAYLNNLFAYIRRIFLTKTVAISRKPSMADRQDTVPLATCLAIGTCLYLCARQMAETGRGAL